MYDIPKISHFQSEKKTYNILETAPQQTYDHILQTAPQQSYDILQTAPQQTYDILQTAPQQTYEILQTAPQQMEKLEPEKEPVPTVRKEEHAYQLLES